MDARSLCEIKMKDANDCIDPETGLITAWDGGTDDCQLYSAELLALNYQEGLALYLDRSIYNNEIASGLFRRKQNDNNSLDNYIGICWTFTEDAKRILTYGQKHFWCFNFETPGKFAFRWWFGRFIGFPPFVKVCAGRKIGLISQLLYSLACLFSLFAKRGDVGNQILQWLMNTKMKRISKILNCIIKIYEWAMLKRYPGGIYELMCIYHGREHPISKAALSRKGGW